MHVKRAGLFLGLGLSVWASAALAQTPGQVGDTLKKSPELKRPPTPPADVNDTRPSAPAPVKGGKAVVVKEFEFEGNTLLPPADLRRAVSEDVGRSLTLFDIYEIADRLTALYVSRGYTLAVVYVPPQRIEGGKVRLEVIEGRVGKITIEGNRHYREASFLDYLVGVQPGDPYRGAALAESLKRLNELPGLSTRAVLRPGEELGTSEVVIQATEKFFEGSSTLDNYGRKDVGEFRYGLSGTLNGPLLAEDQLQVSGLVSEDALLTYGLVSYNVPVDLDGTRVSLSYGEAEFEVDGVAGLKGHNKSTRIKLTHPLLRAQSTRVNVGLGLSSTRGNADIDGVPVSGRTDLQLLEADAEVLHAGFGGGTTQASLSLSSNFARARFAELNSDADEHGRDDQRLDAELEVLHLQPLPRRLEALIHVAGAWSPDPLPDTQKFSLGGPGSVRGYPSSEVRGDRGVLGSVTLRRPFTLGPVAAYGSVFADAGQVSSLDLPRRFRETAGSGGRAQSLSSAGLGFEGSYRKITGKLDWAFPLDNHEASDGRDTSRLFGSLSVAF